MFDPAVLMVGIVVSVFSSAMACGAPYRASDQRPPPARFLGRQDMVLQVGDKDCGLAALATLSIAVGRPVDAGQLRREVVIPPAGLSLLALRQIAARYGIALRGVHVDSTRASSLPTPWIGHFRSRLGHFVVVERREGSYWRIANPSAGRMLYTDAAFRERWSGYALVLEATDALPSATPRR